VKNGSFSREVRRLLDFRHAAAPPKGTLRAVTILYRRISLASEFKQLIHGDSEYAEHEMSHNLARAANTNPAAAELVIVAQALLHAFVWMRARHGATQAAQLSIA
jgi:hypothetical protein